MNEASAASEILPRTTTDDRDKTSAKKIDSTKAPAGRGAQRPLPVLVSERRNERDKPSHVYCTSAGADQAPLRREAAFYAVFETKMYEGSGGAKRPPILMHLHN
jgi:hypothetical protein